MEEEAKSMAGGEVGGGRGGVRQRLFHLSAGVTP